MKNSAICMLVSMSLYVSLSNAAITKSFLQNFGPEKYYVSATFWGGFVLGIQEDSSNTANNCYASYIEMLNSIDYIQEFTNDVYTTAINLQGVSGSTIGYYMSKFKVIQDIQIMVMNFYTNCKGE